MRLISSTFLASLAIAAPYVSGQACSKGKTTQSWTISGYEIFTAAPGSESSNLFAFSVVDPLIGYKREVPNGDTLADPFNYYPCVGVPTKFKWDGFRLSLEEVVECGRSVYADYGESTNVIAKGTSKPVFATDCYETDANGSDGEWCLATYDFNITITLT